MKKVDIVQGRAVPLGRSDIDTDQILPSVWLKQVERTGFERALFQEWRDDKDFVLNKPEFLGANIMVAGSNFGTGSSREHAVWAILQSGFEAVIAPSFGPIFLNNAAKNGLVCVQVDVELEQRLTEALRDNPDLYFVIDIEKKLLEVPELDIETGFDLDNSVQYRFLNGLDDIGITLENADDIDSFEQRRAGYLPKIESAN